MPVEPQAHPAEADGLIVPSLPPFPPAVALAVAVPPVPPAHNAGAETFVGVPLCATKPVFVAAY